MNINRHKLFTKNEAGTDYVVGDIHGVYNLLLEELDEIGFDRTRDRLFSVGDLVDRGSKSFQCLKLLDAPWFFAVQGNHEEMMINCFNNPHDGVQDAHWRSNGGYWAVEAQQKEPEEYARLVQKAAELPYAITVETETGRIGMIHADLPCMDWNDIEHAANESTLSAIMLWSRRRITRMRGEPVANVDVVYFGHTPVTDVVDIENTKYIDTGAVYNGKLTIVKIGEN